jgi:hypothetical protein
MYPDAKDASDAEILDWISQRTGQDIQTTAEMFGVTPGKKRSAIGAGLSSGVDEIQGLGYSAGAAVADTLGAKGARDWFNKRADINELESRINSRPDLERIEDQTLGSAIPFAVYQTAKQAPNIAGGIAAGLLVPEAAVPAALTRAGAYLPRALGGGGLSAAEGYAAKRAALETGKAFGEQVVGGAAYNYGQSVGSVYQEARQNPDIENPGAVALAAGVPYAISETLPEAMLVGRFKTGGGFNGNLLTRMGKAGAVQAGAGATSELIQNEIEMAANGHVSDQEALSRRLNSGVVGGLVEGLLGTSGGFRRAKTLPANNDVGQALQTETDQVQTTNTSVAGGVGQTQSAPPAPPNTSAPPVVQGGNTAIAQATQNNAQQEAQVQAALQQQAAREQVFGQYGVANPQDQTKGSLFGKPIFGQGLVSQVGDAMVAVTGKLNDTQRTLTQAVAQANSETGGKLISYSFNALDPAKSVSKAFDAIGKTLTKFQIGHVQTVDEAAQILDTLSKSAKGDQLEQINAIHTALTGSDTSGYLESQGATKGAKNGSTVQQQNPAGVGTVREQGTAGEAAAGGNGSVRSSEIQSVEPGGLGEGSLGLQTGQVSGEGIRPGSNANPAANADNLAGQGQGSGQVNENAQNTQGAGTETIGTDQGAGEAGATSARSTTAQTAATEEQVIAGRTAWEDMNASGVSYDEVPDQLRAAWNQAVAEGRATGELQESIANESERGTVELRAARLMRRVLDLVILPTSRMKEEMAAKKREFVLAYFGSHANDRVESLAKVAKELGISRDQAKRWSAELPGFVEKNADKLRAALDTAATELKYSVEDMRAALETLAGGNTNADIQEELESGQSTSATEEPMESDEQAGAIDERDENFVRHEGRTGESLQEEFNGTETNNAAILRTLEALNAAENEGNEAEVTRLQAELEKLYTQGTEQYQANQRRVRASAGKQTKENSDAVQEQSTGEMDVRQQARNGERVGEQNTESESTAGQGVQTDAEKAGKAWDKVANTIPGAPKFADLSEEERQDFIDYGSDNWTPDDVRTELVKLNAKFGKDGVATNPYTVAELAKEITDFVRAAVSTRKLKIVESVQDLLKSSDPTEQKLGAAMALNRAFGVASNGRAYLIANRISKGQGRAKFMHEVGVHLGLEGLLTDAQHDQLTDKIFEWAKRDDDSRESQLARRAIERADAAQTPDEDLRSEILAYFVEEAMQSGIDPSAAMKLSGPLGQWFRTLYAAFKVAVRRLGFNSDKLNAQDVVNLAYGAARLEMNGTYHGTAADFRKFNHKYMGSGEGAQAFGWGTYLAQRFGIAKGYWKADVARKTKAADTRGALEQGGNPSLSEVYSSDGGTPLKLTLAREMRVRSSGLYIPTVEVTGSKTPGALSYKAADQIFKKDGTQLFSDAQIQRMQQYVEDSERLPQGAVMRVDVGVDEKDLLDRDEQLYKQPKIAAKIRAVLPESILEELVEETNEFFDEMTGADLYDALKNIEMKTGAVSELFRNVEDYNKRLAGAKPSQVVSTFLDEVAGVPGLKFLDAESRGEPVKAVMVNGKKYTRQDLIDMKRDTTGIGPHVATLRHILRHGVGYVTMELEQKIAKHEAMFEATYKNSSERYKVPYDAAEGRARAKLEAERTYEGEQLKWLKESTVDVVDENDNRTRNLVIFNDKNIFRVGSRGANQRSNTKFGIAANLTDTMPDPVRKKASFISSNLLEAGKRGVLSAAITEDVVNMAKKYMASAGEFLKAQYARQAERLKFELRIERILSAYDKLSDPAKKQVNEFIADSTSKSLWGYTPSYNTKVAIDEGMKNRFNALPAAAQRIVEMTFEHGYEALKAKQAAVKEAADREFDERVKAAAGDPKELADIAKDRQAFETKFNRLLNIKTDKPYAYMGRYGDYVAVAKSAEYISNEKLARQGDKAATKWLEENQSNGDHYYVAFGETQGEVDAIKARLDATGQYERSYAAQKLDKGAYTGGDDLFMAVTRLSRMLARKAKNDITGSMDASSVGHLNKMIGDLYLATVAEASAHTSSMQRKNIAGFDRDMMRNLATRGRADAHFLASLKHNQAITDSIEKMIDESEDDPNRARPYLNELLQRHAQSMDYKTPSVLSRTLTRMSNLYFLASNPAFYLQQMLQSAVLSQPYLSGRLGYFRSARALKRAYNDIAPLLKGLNITDHVDFEKAPADVRVMLQELVGMGKIDIGIDAEARARSGDSGALNKVMLKLQGINTRIETINRAVAAMAAYRGYLDRYKNGDTAAATRFAAEVVSNTHGSYDGFNTPRILSSDTGRVLGQFKRFQIIQLSMLAKLFHSAFNGASHEERQIARKALAFTGAHMAVLGGALGVPFVSQIAWLMTKLFGDPDEPDDPEFKLRRMIGDEAMANLLLKGVPAFLGVDVSGKLAMGNVASILPYNEGDLTSRSGMEKTLVGLLGPSAALALKFADGMGLMGKGDYYKGLEQMLPNGVANVMKGARIASEGVTMRNGDVVMRPEEISMVDAAMQAVGLPTTNLTGRQRLQEYKVEFDKFYNERTTELKEQYVKASREGDTSAMAEARDEWAKLQDSRATNGYKRQPMSDLFRAPGEAAKRTRNMEGNVEFNKQNRGFGRQYANI